MVNYLVICFYFPFPLSFTVLIVLKLNGFQCKWIKLVYYSYVNRISMIYFCFGIINDCIPYVSLHIDLVVDFWTGFSVKLAKEDLELLRCMAKYHDSTMLDNDDMNLIWNFVVDVFQIPQNFIYQWRISKPALQIISFV